MTQFILSTLRAIWEELKITFGSFIDKTFDITYVRVLFESPRPESWAIYRQRSENSPWEPYQYYSATCRDTYGLPESKETVRGDDSRVLCTSEYSDIVPLSRGTVAFSTLEGRPSAYFFDTNTELQVFSEFFSFILLFYVQSACNDNILCNTTAL